MSAIYPVDVAEIDATITSLASRYPTLCNAAACVATTAEGRTVRYLRIRGGAKPAADRLKVLLVGGLHAREYAPPALLLRLVARLCTAYSGTVTPIVTGTVTFPEEKVRKVMEGLDLYVLPLVNPDGRAFNRASDRMWRKNRRVFPGPNRIGVDVNRNFPVGRDFRRFYDAADPGVRTAVVIEDDWVNPEHDPYEVFRGDLAAEEPETRNVMDLIDTLKPNVFVDVHAFGPDVLYPWSLETNQTSDPDKNFANAAWDRRRDATSGGGSAYEEWIPSKMVKLHQEAGKAMTAAMNAAAPSPATPARTRRSASTSRPRPPRTTPSARTSAPGSGTSSPTRWRSAAPDWAASAPTRPSTRPSSGGRTPACWRSSTRPRTPARSPRPSTATATTPTCGSSGRCATCGCGAPASGGSSAAPSSPATAAPGRPPPPASSATRPRRPPSAPA